MATYASWNVVFIKNDWCWHKEPDQSKHLAVFNAMRDAIVASGKKGKCDASDAARGAAACADALSQEH